MFQICEIIYLVPQLKTFSEKLSFLFQIDCCYPPALEFACYWAFSVFVATVRFLLPTLVRKCFKLLQNFRQRKPEVQLIFFLRLTAVLLICRITGGSVNT